MKKIFVVLIVVVLTACHAHVSNPIIGKWNFSHNKVDLSINDEKKKQVISDYIWGILEKGKRNSWVFQKDGKFIDNGSYVGTYKYEANGDEITIYTYMTWLGNRQDSLGYNTLLKGDTLVFYKDFSPRFDDPFLRSELDIDDITIKKAMIYSYFVKE